MLSCKAAVGRITQHATWPDIVSTADLARLLCLDERTIRSYGTRGIFRKAPERGAFLFEPSVQAYAKHLREAVNGQASGNLSMESALLKRAQRQHYELKNSVASGEMVPLATIKPAWARTVLSIRQAMLAVPGKARIMLGFDSEAAKTLT